MQYRTYKIQDGHIAEPGQYFEAANDRFAVEVARDQSDGKSFEVWEGTRLVSTQKS